MKKSHKKRISIKIITLFPGFTDHYTTFGIIARAISHKILKFKSIDLRKFGIDARKTVDDRPYGGGVGMVLRPDVVYKAIQKSTVNSQQSAVGQKRKKTKVILMTPQGKPLSQQVAQDLAKNDELIFVCGRFEGFDERIRQFADMEISIGDYVLMGGELPALVVSESVLRFVPGVLGKDESAVGESFADGLLEHPQYTKPAVWDIKNTKTKKIKKYSVPEVLLSGNHAKIDEWRREESRKRTQERRPDLLPQ